MSACVCVCVVCARVCVRAHMCRILGLAFHFPSSPPEPRHKLGCQDSPDIDLMKLGGGEVKQDLVPGELPLVLIGLPCIREEAGVYVSIPRPKQ